MRLVAVVLACALLVLLGVTPIPAQGPTAPALRFDRRIPIGARMWTLRKKPPPVFLMQGSWENEDRTPGLLSRIWIAGSQITASVRTADGEHSLGQTDAQLFCGGPDEKWSLDVTRMTAAFTTDTAHIEITATFVKTGRLEVEEIVRYPATSTSYDRWFRFDFRGGPETAMLLREAAPPIPMFPWPPPRASFSDVVPDGLALRTSDTETLGAIFDRISQAITLAGFARPSVYAIPNQTGFVVVTQLENIKEDGRPLEDRFSMDPRPDVPRSVGEWLRALTHAPPGLYRVIVLVVTNGTVTESDQEPSKDDAASWLHEGVKWLPPEMAATPLQGGQCEALVYEFKKPAEPDSAPVVWQDNLNALGHLKGAGIWREAIP